MSLPSSIQVPLIILLVDDDAEFANATAESLRRDGHSVRIASDGASALVLARDLRPDAVLLDLGLPDEDGCDVARALRRHLPKTTPIIVVTGPLKANHHVDDDVDLTLNKPFASELLGGLIEYIRRRRWNTVRAHPPR